jgi:hypothetical protein
MEVIFFCCIPKCRSFCSVVSYTTTNLKRCTVSHNTEAFSALYPTLDNYIFFVINTTQKNKIEQLNFSLLRDTTQKYLSHCIQQRSRFLPWYPTMEAIFLRYGIQRNRFKIFLRCGIQRKRFSSIVGYNRGGFPPLLKTTEEVFLHCGIQWKRFLSIVGYNGEKYNSE